MHIFSHLRQFYNNGPGSFKPLALQNHFLTRSQCTVAEWRQTDGSWLRSAPFQHDGVGIETFLGLHYNAFCVSCKCIAC